MKKEWEESFRQLDEKLTVGESLYEELWEMTKEGKSFVICPEHLGDSVYAASLLHAYKLHNGIEELYVVCSESQKDLLGNFPGVDGVVSLLPEEMNDLKIYFHVMRKSDDKIRYAHYSKTLKYTYPDFSFEMNYRTDLTVLGSAYFWLDLPGDAKPERMIPFDDGNNEELKEMFGQSVLLFPNAQSNYGRLSPNILEIIAKYYLEHGYEVYTNYNGFSYETIVPDTKPLSSSIKELATIAPYFSQVISARSGAVDLLAQCGANLSVLYDGGSVEIAPTASKSVLGRNEVLLSNILDLVDRKGIVNYRVVAGEEEELLQTLMFQGLQKGFLENPYNYKLYDILGDCYMQDGKGHQAYIAYSQALFYCDNETEIQSLKKKKEDLKNSGVIVPKTAIVLLSWNLKDFTAQSVNSIRQTTDPEEREIIVVDNGSEDESVAWLKEQSDIRVWLNSDNHGFPKGCNEGIALASEDADIFLLNNDTVLPPNALFWLRIGLYENEEVGATGSMSNYVSNDQMIEEQFQTPEEVLEYALRTNVLQENPYTEKKYLVGFALLLKRTALDQVGLLDERFTPGNAEDVDICLRLRIAGYKNLLCKNSVILHFGSQSFQKLGKEFQEVMLKNIDKLNEKYGCDMREVLHSEELFEKFLESAKNGV